MTNNNHTRYSLADVVKGGSEIDKNASLSFIDKNYDGGGAEQLEEYEKLFQIMNGPIENLVNYSRAQMRQIGSQKNRTKSFSKPFTIRIIGDNKRAQTAIGGQKPPVHANNLQIIDENRYQTERFGAPLYNPDIQRINHTS